MRRITRLSSRLAPRFAATEDAFPGVTGYGATPDEAERALEEKLPRAPSRPLPSTSSHLPLSPAHRLRARPIPPAEDPRALAKREKRERSDDALDRAILIGSVDSDRRRH